MNSALILVDIQRDYFPGGRMELVGAVEASREARRLLDSFREKGLPVVHIQHVAMKKDATFFIPGTEGVEFHEDVAPLPSEKTIVKHFPNSFRDTGLDEHLVSLGVDTLVVCGMMSQMCIDATVRAAFDKGHGCLVAHDACATRDLTFNGATIPAAHVHGSFMAALASAYAKVMGAREIIEILNGR